MRLLFALILATTDSPSLPAPSSCSAPAAFSSIVVVAPDPTVAVYRASHRFPVVLGANSRLFAESLRPSELAAAVEPADVRAWLAHLFPATV